MKHITSLLTCLLISFQLQAQAESAKGHVPGRDLVSTAPSDSYRIVINHEMIGRFNSITSEGELYSWSQLLTRYSANESLEIAKAYKLSDLSEKSLLAIRMEIESKLDLEPGKQDPELAEYLVYLNKVKEAVNNRLREPQPVAMK